MQLNDVKYVFGFCTAICLGCSVIVASSAVGLRDIQERNKRLDRQKKVLAVAGLIKEKQAISSKQIQNLFRKRMKAVVINLKKGTIDKQMTQNAKSFDQREAKNNPKTSRDAPKNFAGILRVPEHALVYMVSKTEIKTDGSGFSLASYIFPVEGKGLWSTLYGFVAMAPDLNEIRGLTFYEHGETPGLGGEIENPAWQAKWLGRLLYGPKDSTFASWGKPKIEVIKGAAGPPKKDPYDVDGLSGATITSNGVTKLLRFWFGSHGFRPFIRRQLKARKKGRNPFPTLREPALPKPSQPAPRRGN